MIPQFGFNTMVNHSRWCIKWSSSIALCLFCVLFHLRHSFFCKVFNEINSREIEKINIFKGMFESWIFFTVIFSTVVFQVLIVEFLGTFASTVPLSWQFWVLSVVIGAFSMPISAILKCIPVERGDATTHHDGYEALPSGPELA